MSGSNSSLLELSARIIAGTEQLTRHPFASFGDLEEVGDGIAFVSSLANVSAFATEDGLVLVDTGSQMAARQVHQQIRGWRPDRLNTAVFSHGHIDHVFGVGPFEEESSNEGWEPPRVVAHEDLPARFDRYILTAGYNQAVNRRQFSAPGLVWPVDYRYPDETYRTELTLDVGGEVFELRHARGETDDHTWTWVPGRKALACGDFFIWASPNAGNPQKVQRYPKEWAIALREMASVGAELLLPGHGLPVAGAADVAMVLTDAASLLESLHDQTVALMNQGARLDDIVNTVKPPADLMAKPYLQPTYDEPEFVVRSVWRLYGGWWDGNPANLKPAPEAAVAAELAALAGGAHRLAERARELAGSGTRDGPDLRLAGNLAELAALADPSDPAILETKADVFTLRVAAEASTMSKGVFRWAADDARDRARKSQGGDTA